MTSPDKLALASRCEQAGGYDRMLDWEIHGVFGIAGIGSYGAHPAYTASLDAITSLIAEKLPGWTWGVFDDGTAWVWSDAQRDLLRGFQGKGSTPCNGLVAAFLRALASTEDKQP